MPKNCQYKIISIDAEGRRLVEPCGQSALLYPEADLQPMLCREIQFGKKLRKCYPLNPTKYCYYHTKIINELINKKENYHDRGSQSAAPPLVSINPKAANKSLSIGGPKAITHGELLNLIAKEAGINANYTEGISKEELIEQVRNNPGRSFFTPEQMQDFINDNTIDHSVIKDIFGIDFQTVEEFMKEAVPQVKAAMAGQAK